VRKVTADVLRGVGVGGERDRQARVPEQLEIRIQLANRLVAARRRDLERDA
jgi:hypothetical protein